MNNEILDTVCYSDDECKYIALCIESSTFNNGYIVYSVCNDNKDGSSTATYYKVKCFNAYQSESGSFSIICGNGRGLIDMKNKLVIPPNKYEFISRFYDNGVAVVTINRDTPECKCGLINTKGEEITPIMYEKSHYDIKKSLLTLYHNDLEYVVDVDGIIRYMRNLKIGKIINGKTINVKVKVL